MIYTHATIISMNAAREILTDGAIRVQGDRIEAVAKTADLVAAHPQRPNGRPHRSHRVAGAL